MEQMRLLLAIVLSFLVFVVWQWLFVEPEMARQAQDQTTVVEEPAQTRDAPSPTTAPADTVVSSGPMPEPTEDGRKARVVRVETPLFSAVFSEKGATLDDLTIKNYRETTAPDSGLKDMVRPRARLINFQTGLTGGFVKGLEDAVYQLTTQDPVLMLTEPNQSIAFEWVSREGFHVQKLFTFSPDSYLIDLTVTITNHSTQPVTAQPFIRAAKVVDDPEGFIFEGPIALKDGQLQEIKIKDIADTPEISGAFRWIGLTDRYFMTVLIPKEVVPATLKMESAGEDMAIVELVMPQMSLDPQRKEVFSYQAFIGPKDTEALDLANYDLGKAVNFGWFDFLAKPFLWIMNQIYKFIPNYGIAIIILTLITKIILWPLGNKSYKSMNDMKRIQPLMVEIREKYKNDKKKMNEETMALYRTYKVNPVGGCLPMVLQLPVFFALYSMLYLAIELRHAPFFGWIDDLSAPDRLFHFGCSIPFMQPPIGIPVLTIIMGATMFLQQKMSPPPGDPTQAKMMMFMPLIFTFIFINFSSGLVLYWLINNIFSIAQQYYIQKKYA